MFYSLSAWLPIVPICQIVTIPTALTAVPSQPFSFVGAVLTA